MLIRSTIKKKEQKNKGGLAGGATYIARSTLAGFGGVGEGIIDLFSAAGYAMAGHTEYAKYVFKDNVVGDWHEDITEEYNPDAVWKFGGDVAHGLGQSSWFLLNLIPGANWVGTAAFGAGMVGQGISGAAEQTGDVGLKEVGYGVTTAAIETTLGHFLSGTSTLAKNIGGSIAKSTGKSALKSIASSATRKGLVKSILSDAAGEFAEEFISEYTDTFLQRAYQIDPDAEYSLKNALYSGFVGAVSGSISAGTGDVVNAVSNQQRGARIIKNGNSQTLVNTANLVADKLAGSGTNFKNAPQWVKTLRGEVDAYNKLAAKGQQNSLSGQTILGEMQASLFFAEMQAQNAGIQEVIQNSSDENRAALAEYVNRAVDKSKRKKDFTAEDIAKNTDDVAKQLAIMKQVGYGFDIDGAIYGATTDMAQEAAIGTKIETERNGASFGTENISGEHDSGITKFDIDSNLLSFYREVSAMKDKNAKSKRKKNLGKISQTHANLISDTIKKETGKTIDLSGYELWIDGSAINHIEERHGKNGAKDQSMQDENDVSRITWVANNAENAEVLRNADGSLDLDNHFKNKDQSPSIKVKLSSRIDDSTFYVVECVPDSVNKRLQVKSAYKQKNSGKGQELNIESENSPQHTSETSLDSNATDNIIHPNEPVVNSENKKSSQQSIANNVASTAPNGDVENSKSISQKDGAVKSKSEKSAVNKNSGGRTPSANANAFAGTSKTNGRSSTNNSIHQNEPVVNSESKKNIDKADLVDKGEKTAQESGEVSKGAETREAKETSAEDKESGKAAKKVQSAEGRVQSEEKSSESENKSSETKKDEPKVSDAKEALTDEQRKEKARKRAEAWLEWEKKTSPTVKELNTAREYVKEFDNLSNPRRLAIIRMIRSAEGKVDKKILKGVANLMAVNPLSDLEIRFAEGLGGDKGGFVTKIGNKTVIVIDSSTDFKNTIQGTIAHELVHYLENKAGYKEFAAFVRKHAKPEAVERHRKRYTDFYRELITAQLMRGEGEVSGKYDIVVLENGNTYVTASRKIINGKTLSEKRRDISDFFTTLLNEKSSLDIQTIEGDILTITKSETADKARDNYKYVNGKRVKLADDEFIVKLHAEAHIDELAETSLKSPKSPSGDEKNHSFAKDGFTYRTAYFEDFDGQYYQVTLSVGHNGTVATVYNVGKIKESVPSSAKIIAVVGSRALDKTLSDNIISQKHDIVNPSEEKSQQNKLSKDEKIPEDIKVRVEERLASAEIQELIESEITAKLAGQALNNERFLKRYADRDKKFIQKAFEWMKERVTRLKKNGKDTEEVSEVADEMAHRLIVLLQTKETTGESNGSKKYSFAGEKAKTADKMKLATAKEMLEGGVDSETVRKETGWFKSYDGKWRFEINDEEMKVSVPTSQHAKVGDIVDHPLLFEAYPELKETKIRFDDELSDATAIFYPQFNEIVLTGLLKKHPKILKETLIHEMQHVVQEIEGFAKGSSPEYWLKARRDAQLKYDSLKKDLDQWLTDIGYERFAEETKARVLAGEISPKERAKALKDFFKNPLYAEELARREAELDKLNKDWPKLHQVGDGLGIATVKDMYYATAGEIEARDAAGRSEFTDAQRKIIRPEVDWKHAVFAEDGVSYEIKYPRFTQKEIDDNIQTVATMQSVITISEDKLKPTGKAPSVLYEEYFKSLGENIYSEIYGDIAIKRSSVKSEIRHGNTAEKIASMEAIPTVIDQGKIIAIIDKGAGVERLVIAAPIVIGKTDYLMGVMLQRDAQNQRLYLHNVVIKEKTTKSQEVDLLTTGTYNENDRLFITSILQKVLSVNTSKAKNIAKADLADRKYDLVEKDSENDKRAKEIEKKEEKIKKKEKELRAREKEVRKKEIQNSAVKTYTRQEIYKKVLNEVENYSFESISKILSGDVKAEISKKEKQKLVRNIYYLLHEASEQGEAGRGSVVVKGIAVRMADEYIEKMRVTQNGKSYKMSELFDEETLNAHRQEVADVLWNAFCEIGRETEIGRIVARLRKLEIEYREKYIEHENFTKYSKIAKKHAKVLKNLVKREKRSIVDEGIVTIAKALSASVSGDGNVRVGKVDAAAAQAADFYNENNKVIFDGKSKSGEKTESLTDFASEYNPELREMIDEFIELRKDRQGKPLTADEVKLWAHILGGLKSVIRAYDRVYKEGKWVTLSEQAKNCAEDISSFYGENKEYSSKVIAWLSQKSKGFKELYFYSVISPENVIEAIEGYSKDGILKSFYHQVRGATQRAEKMSAELLIPFAEFLDNKDNYFQNADGKKISYRKKMTTHKVNLFGQEMTLGEAIYIYMLTKRKHAESGLKKGGIKIFDDDGKIVGRLLEVDPELARDAIMQQFDDIDRRYIELAERFFNVYSTQIKSDADYEYLGYTNILDEYYVPIIRDRYSRDRSATDPRSSIADIITAYNPSFNKDVVNNSKPLEIVNIQEIIERHARGLADYANLYMPLKSFDRIYNSTVTLNNGTKTTVRELLNQNAWTGTEKYLRNLFADIQGSGRNQQYTFLDEIVGTIRSGWVQSVLSANPKVIVTQTTSYVAARQVIEEKYLVSALGAVGHSMKELGERADKYSDIILARSFDMGALKSQTNIEKVSGWGKKLGQGIEWTDRNICLLIFHAAEIKVREMEGFAIGTEENARLAAKIADETIYTTQAMTSQAERSALQRAPSEISKSFAIFSSDSMKQLSHLYSNIARYIAHTQRAKSDEAYKAELDKDRKKIGRSAVTVIATGVALAAIAQVFKYLYHKEEEELDEKIKDAAGDIVFSTLGIFPIFSDIAEKWVNDYDISSSIFDWVNDTIEDSRDLFTNLFRAAIGENVSDREIYLPVKNTILNVATVLGIPLAPIERTSTGLLRRFAPGAAYEYYDSLFYSQSYTSDLKKAVESGDEALAEHILLSLWKDQFNGTYSTEALEEISRLYFLTDENGGAYDVLPQKIPSDLTSRKQRKQFEAIYSEANGAVFSMVGKHEYQKLTDREKASVITNIYKLYFNKAKTEVLGEKMTNAQVYAMLLGDTSNLFLAQAKKSSMEEYKDSFGKTVTVKEQLTEYLNGMELSEKERLIISYALGYKSKANKALLLQFINSLNLSEEQKIQIAERLGFEIKNGVLIEANDE